MKIRLLMFAAAALAASALASCGAANSLYQTTDRMVQAAGRTLTGGQ
jgi:hypothetical protein